MDLVNATPGRLESSCPTHDYSWGRDLEILKQKHRIHEINSNNKNFEYNEENEVWNTIKLTSIRSDLIFCGGPPP